jgi:hypothetical protein
MKKITVIGCGKVGRAFAYDMLKKGHEVRLVDSSPEIATGAYMDLFFCGHVKAGLSPNIAELIFLSARNENLDEIITSVKACSYQYLERDKLNIPIFVFSNPVKEITEKLRDAGFTRVIPCDTRLDCARAFKQGQSTGLIQEDIHASPKNQKLTEIRKHWLDIQEGAYRVPSVYSAIHFAEQQLEELRLI